MILVKFFFWSFCFSERRKDGEEITRRQAQEFVPPLQGLEDLGNLNPGLRSVLALGHYSLGARLLSVGLSAFIRFRRDKSALANPRLSASISGSKWLMVEHWEGEGFP